MSEEREARVYFRAPCAEQRWGQAGALERARAVGWSSVRACLAAEVVPFFHQLLRALLHNRRRVQRTGLIRQVGPVVGAALWTEVREQCASATRVCKRESAMQPLVGLDTRAAHARSSRGRVRTRCSFTSSRFSHWLRLL